MVIVLMQWELTNSIGRCMAIHPSLTTSSWENGQNPRDLCFLLRCKDYARQHHEAFRLEIASHVYDLQKMKKQSGAKDLGHPLVN